MSDATAHVEKSLANHGSDANGTDNNALCRVGRSPSLLRGKLFPAAAALFLLALAILRNEESLILRNDSESDPATTLTIVNNESSIHEIVADLDNQQQLQTQTNSAAAALFLATENLIDLDKQQEPVNWTRLHLAEREKTERNFQVLKSKLQSRFKSLEQADEILGYPELAKQFRPLLQQRGLLMMGDSTSRMLFGALWCVMDGIFPADGDNNLSACDGRQEALKKKCRASMNSSECGLRASFSKESATFSNETANFHLSFQRHQDVGWLDDRVVEVMRDNRDRFIFFLLPCLHALWAPGGREKSVRSRYPSWNTSFHELYTSVEQANPAHSFLLGTTVAVCDSKLWETPLIEMYLQGENFVNGEPSHEFKLYNAQRNTSLHANYSGPVPVMSSFRENHTCDNSLSDEGGALKCSSVGLEVLLEHTLITNPAVRVVDMHGATEFGCNDTDDGRHYKRGLTLRRELTLLLRAMQSAL